MIDVVAVVIGLAALVTLSAVLLGCIQWFHRLIGVKDVAYQQDIESSPGSSQTIIPDQGPMFPPAESVDNDSVKGITFEPLPDIVGKAPVHEPALRPRVSSAERASEQVRLGGARYEIPRGQLFFVNEIGSGWFGQVLQGDAEILRVGENRTKVTVKVLKDDATPREQLQFLKEVLVYRDLDHANILHFLGQCTETIPYLTILEHVTLGDLKTYLLTNRGDRETVIQRGSLLKFACDMAAGLACMHQHDFIHRDFATRNCLVTHDLCVKVGDYGVSEDIYKDDYMDIGDDLIPVRWMAPETVTVHQGEVIVTEITQKSNIWSFGVALWELCEFGGQPYSSLTNEEVVTQVMVERFLQLPEPSLLASWKNKMYDVLKYCWMEQRPAIETVHKALQQLQAGVLNDNTAEFDAKWDQIVPKKARVVNVAEFQSSNETPPLDLMGNGMVPLSGKTELIVMADVMMEDNTLSELPIPKVVTKVKTEPDTWTPSKNGSLDGFQMTSTPVTKADTPSSYTTAPTTPATPSHNMTSTSIAIEPVKLPTVSNIDNLSLSRIERDPDAIVVNVPVTDSIVQLETEPEVHTDSKTKETNEDPTGLIQLVETHTEEIVNTNLMEANTVQHVENKDLAGEKEDNSANSDDVSPDVPVYADMDKNEEAVRVESPPEEVPEGGGLLIDVSLDTPSKETSAKEDGANNSGNTEGEVTSVVPTTEPMEVEESTPVKETADQESESSILTGTTPPQTASLS